IVRARRCRRVGRGGLPGSARRRRWAIGWTFTTAATPPMVAEMTGSRERHPSAGSAQKHLRGQLDPQVVQVLGELRPKTRDAQTAQEPAVFVPPGGVVEGEQSCKVMTSLSMPSTSVIAVTRRLPSFMRAIRDQVAS